MKIYAQPNGKLTEADTKTASQRKGENHMSNFMNAKNIIEASKRQMKIIEEKQKTMQECEELYDLEDILLLLECVVNLLASPRFTAEEREAMKAVLRLAQEQMYRAEATNVKGNSPNNLRWSEIYKEYLSHMNTVRKMLEGSV